MASTQTVKTSRAPRKRPPKRDRSLSPEQVKMHRELAKFRVRAYENSSKKGRYPDAGTLFPRSVCRDSRTETLNSHTI